jgi:hypothetical protein
MVSRAWLAPPTRLTRLAAAARRVCQLAGKNAAADAKDRRTPTPEIEWNGEMIGDLRRRSSAIRNYGATFGHCSSTLVRCLMVNRIRGRW